MRRRTIRHLDDTIRHCYNLATVHWQSPNVPFTPFPLFFPFLPLHSLPQYPLRSHVAAVINEPPCYPGRHQQERNGSVPLPTFLFTPPLRQFVRRGRGATVQLTTTSKQFWPPVVLAFKCTKHAHNLTVQSYLDSNTQLPWGSAR